jgi:hypothetical protein
VGLNGLGKQAIAGKRHQVGKVRIYSGLQSWRDHFFFKKNLKNLKNLKKKVQSRELIKTSHSDFRDREYAVERWAKERPLCPGGHGSGCGC